MAAALSLLLALGSAAANAAEPGSGAASPTAGEVSSSGASSDVATEPVPLLAYYYIWFNPTSWNRAKNDYPALGRYSSDEVPVMVRHVEWAKQAGINGFIVSWKRTPLLNRRLDNLVEVATQLDFKLSIIYQGLDYFRHPLKIRRVAEDLEFFVDRYGSAPAFDLFGDPVVIWSGSWEFAREEINSVVNLVGEDVHLLASEHGPDEYAAVADLFEGNAYYWSSVNPDTYPRYPQKLRAMSRVIHDDGGLWIAPAAPGFDGRLVGGSTVVPRDSGNTLRVQMNTAMRSSPDAIGLISWNEFSENTHVEPSVEQGAAALRVLADIRGAPPPEIPDFDSSEPGGFSINAGTLGLLASLILISGISLVAIARRDNHPQARHVRNRRSRPHTR